MISAVSRSWQALKSHAPLIKFRKGGPSVSDSHSPMAAEKDVLKRPSTGNQTVAMNVAIDDNHLPLKYARKSLSDLEIQYVMRGGPE